MMMMTMMMEAILIVLSCWPGQSQTVVGVQYQDAILRLNHIVYVFPKQQDLDNTLVAP
jgi:hypothetical protein